MASIAEATILKFPLKVVEFCFVFLILEQEEAYKSLERLKDYFWFNIFLLECFNTLKLERGGERYITNKLL